MNGVSHLTPPTVTTVKALLSRHLLEGSMGSNNANAEPNVVDPSTALDDDRAQIDVGLRLRAVRKARRRTLRDVANSAEITEGFLSQVERGKSNASVAVLRRIAVTLGVTIGDLFQENSVQGLQVLTAAMWPTLGFGVLGRKYHLHSAHDREFDAFICDFEPGGSTGAESYAHGDSEELVLVLMGSAVLTVGDDVVSLKCNDSTVYRSNVLHRLVADSATGARVLFITSPPSF
jgi:transcriptional regulator with XRE-family HTH domain